MNTSDITVPLTSMKRWTPWDWRNGWRKAGQDAPGRLAGRPDRRLLDEPVTVVVAVISSAR